MGLEGPRWTVPREWDGERCFILCGGASLPIGKVPQLRGRIIAIKQTVLLRPTADVMFVAGKDDARVCADYFPLYRGPRLVYRSIGVGFPERTLFLRRAKAPFSDDPSHLGGLDAGASAINLAYHFGAREIVLLGMDMCGGRWVKKHHMPQIPQSHFDRHIEGLNKMAPELKKRGVRVVNCSPVTALRCFERADLKEFL